jgi:DNA-binding NarL/FixJ family response regulator
MNATIKLALVDDHHFIIKSLQQNLSLFEGIDIFLTAANGEELLEKMETEVFCQVILMDLDMPVMKGIHTAAEIRKRFSDNVKIIILTVFDDEDKIFDAIKAGANGYLLKDEKPERIGVHKRSGRRRGAYVSFHCV